ncbi:uncharacterized protein [Amphiura filiformis]|uniref:uncharacterized protein n=1 Tax=Amphiura filiformis TaxID=82378 RepID=UPI003B21E8EC
MSWFIDYQKAFDSIDHTDMFDALRKSGINENYICILEDIYTDAIAKIHIDDVSKKVRIERGVRQGDTLSPKIFTAALEEVLKKSNLERKGISIDGEILTDLRFADDVALTTTSVKDMEDQLNSLCKESIHVGLQMHKGKTQFMTNFETKETITIANHQIKKVHNYKYLGQTLRMDTNTAEEILIRVKAGWRCFGMHKELLTDKNIPLSLRRRVYDQCVLITMTYGAETWSTTKEMEQKLVTAQRAMERKMLHLSLRERVRHTEIRKVTQVKDILQKIKETKWRWAGHLSRTDDNRWTKRLTEWQPRTGKRRRGRQKRRWRDDITTFMSTTAWASAARNRRRWKMLEEGFTQQWVKQPDEYPGNSFAAQNGQAFTTHDADHDDYGNNCAVEFKGGWWYGSCHKANLNGLYLNGPYSSYADGIAYVSWKGLQYSLAVTEMKVRPAAP